MAGLATAAQGHSSPGMACGGHLLLVALLAVLWSRGGCGNLETIDDLCNAEFTISAFVVQPAVVQQHAVFQGGCSFQSDAFTN